LVIPSGFFSAPIALYKHGRVAIIGVSANGYVRHINLLLAIAHLGFLLLGAAKENKQ
jgi:hypothetical protein